MEGTQFTVGLSGGQTVTGSLVAGKVQCRGRSVAAEQVIALDRHTLYLVGAVQVDVAAEPAPHYRGFLELEVAGVGPVTVPLERVETIIQHPA